MFDVLAIGGVSSRGKRMQQLQGMLEAIADAIAELPIALEAAKASHRMGLRVLTRRA